MSFLFEPVSAAIDTLKLIKSASNKGPDPARFVTRVPLHPGKWALTTTFKRRHNIWKWTNYKPSTVPRKRKNKFAIHKIKIKPPGADDQDSERGTPGGVVQESSQDDLQASSGVKLPQIGPSKPQEQSPDTAETVITRVHSQESAHSKSPRKGSIGSARGSAPLDEDGMPYFHIPDDEETENEARRVAALSPEQKVYHHSCEHFKVKALRQITKQIDTPEMALGYTRLRDIEFKALTAGMVMNFTVKRLDLTDTALSERQMTYLNDFLEDDNGITDLILRDNKLEGRMFARMFDTMSIRDVMVYLDISGNNLRDKDLPALAAYIESASQLNYLHMARNKFTYKAGEPLGKMMSQAALLELNVGCNALRGDGMMSFLNSVAKNPSLERLNLSWNGIGPEAVRGLCTLLRQNTSIVHLDLSGTRLNSECMEMICAQGLAKNTVLQRIELKNNPILAQDLTTFLNKLNNYPNTAIKRVDLGDYQMLESSAEPLLEALFWQKNIYIRCAGTFAYSKHAERVENLVHRFRKDALSLVTRLDQEERTTLVKHFAHLDMQEAMDTGQDIFGTSFLGRVNDNKVTYKDLALRIMQEPGLPHEVIKDVLSKPTTDLEKGAAKITTISRFSSDPDNTRKMHLRGT